MPKGKPLTEEHKKKISEALTKNHGTQETTARGAAAQAYLNKFVDKKIEYEDAKAQRDDLISQAKALGKTKATAGSRKEIRKAISDLNKQMNQARKVMVAIKAEANGERRKKMAEVFLKKAEARINQYNALTSKVSDLLVRTTDPDRRKRLQDQLNRALNNKVSLEGRMADAKSVAAGKGRIKPTDKTFSFKECLHFLVDQDFDPPRELTMQEKRVNFEKLNDRFNEQQGEVGDEMIALINEELDRITNQAQAKLNAWDIVWIGTLAFLFRSKIAELIRGSVKNAYETGKSMAVSELGIGGRAIVTPLLDTQLMNIDAADISEAYVSALEGSAKSALKAGVASEASIPATIAAMRTNVQNEAARAITNITGTIVGQYINRGRDMVFTSNLTRIKSFQRSEVLDMRTCPTCLELDGLVIKPEDPMRNLEIVHTHCRGLWVPIFTQDEEQPEVTGIPARVTDRFEMIDGRPVVNAFKQVKKPINEASKAAQEEIKRRLK